MEPARALADLVEISPQIEAAVVFGPHGDSLGCIGVTDWWATAVTRAGQALLEGAAELPSEGRRVTQLHASLRDGEVFAVRGGERSIVAVTSGVQAPGLAFYDLKRCLAALDDGEPDTKPRRRRRLWGEGEGDA